MARFNIKVKRTDKYGKAYTSRVGADIGRATKVGVEAIGRAIMRQAKVNAEASIRHTKPYNRPHRGGSANKSYFDSWKLEIFGSRLNWRADVWNTALDAFIQESGRKKGRPVGIKNAATYRKIKGWAYDRGLIGTWTELKQRRTKKGQFRRKRVLSEKQVVFLVAKAIRRNGRPANRTLDRAAKTVLKQGRNSETDLGQRIADAIR